MKAATDKTAAGHAGERQDHYDAVVVGGGIQGAGCAQALAAAGHRVLLVEQSHFGSGTSCRSSKLIHGGLRYLESGQWRLVRKSLRERELLQRLAKGLIESRAFYLPVYRGQRLARWKIIAALLLYRLLAGGGPQTAFRRLKKSQWPTLDGLRQTGLIDVFQYCDGQTDDRQLTRAVICSAVALGCDAREQTRLVAADYSDQTCDGSLQLTLQCHDERQTVHCHLLVNAAGPWVDRVQRSIAIAPPSPAFTLVQGSHLEYDQALGEGIFYIESPDDQRAVFIMPWKNKTLVGTTEQPFSGDPADSRPSEEEIAYLKRSFEHHFPDYRGRYLGAWSGLRVLCDDQRATRSLRPFSSRERDTRILTDNRHRPRIISLYGGKLTTYRATAESVARLAAKTLPPAQRQQATSDIVLMP